MYRYENKLSADDVVVALLMARAVRSLPEGLSEYGRQYGFSFVEVDEPNDLTALREARLKHLIVVSDWTEWAGLKRWLRRFLVHIDSAALALDYRNTEDFLSSAEEVDFWKAETTGRLNFLMPVRNSDGSWRVPVQKILDNSVCDTVRVKYAPNRVATTIPPLAADERHFFLEASRTIESFKLYFRSSTDGYIALRSDRSPGFYVTATKTDKVRLDLGRVSFVHSYDRSTNCLRYSGEFLPSSDSVEAAIAFEDHPEVRALVHTHGSRLFTRNPRHNDRVLVPAMAYGTPALGNAISGAIADTGCDWLIMEDHGELFLGGNGREALSRVKQACKVELAALRGE